MKLSEIAGTLGLDEVESIRPIPLTDDMVGPVPPRPKDHGQQRGSTTDRARRRVLDRKQRAGV